MGSTPPPKISTILVVDDEKEITNFLVEALGHYNLKAEGFYEPEAAFEWGKTHDFDLLITDLKMEKLTGLDLHEKLRIYYPDLLTILITAYQSFDTAQQAISSSIYAYLSKPFKMDEMMAWIHRALDKKSLLDRNHQLVEEQQLLIEKLLTANKELKKLDRLKSDFVSNVSHELRTPLTSIRNVLYNMRLGIGGPLSEKQAEYLKMVEEDSQRLQNLISDILDLSQLDSGHVQLKRAPFKVRESVESVVKLFESVGSEKDLQFFMEFREGAGELMVDADKVKIEQVLVNLINNAVKYIGEGRRIWVEAAPKESTVVFLVRDEGIGISEEDQKRVFDRFEQLEKMARGGTKGIGLGLSIVKKILEMHGQEIQVQSSPGKGSTFTFELPINRHN